MLTLYCAHMAWCLFLQCKEMCVEVQDHFLKELRDLSEVSMCAVVSS